MGMDAINVSLVFRIGKYYPKVLNYIHLVYDYVDKDNYKYLGIMLNEKGQVYALNCSKVRGDHICDPSWPGVYVGDDFNTSIDHRLSISFDIKQGVARLELDNYRAIIFKAKVNGGAIGVRVDRFHSVIIKSLVLSLEAKPLISLRGLIEETPSSNRTIVVLSTTDHGDIYNMLSKKESSVLLSASSVDIYLEHVDSTTIIYLDLKTSLEDILRNESVVETLSKALRQYFSSFDVESYRRSVILSANVVTDEIICKNAEIISRSFILVPIERQKPCINIVCYNGSAAEFITLKPFEHETLKINAVNVSVSKGNGFYALIRVAKAIIPANTVVQLYLLNSSSLVFKLRQDIMLNNVTLITKTPTIITNESLIKGVLLQGLRYPYIAKDLVLRGTSTIKYIVGDDLLLLMVKTFNAEYIGGLRVYDEIITLPLLLKYGAVYVLTLILILALKLLEGIPKDKSPSN